MSEYDIYLRHASVRGGEWTGFLLAWRGLHRHDGFPARPHLYERPWVLDPASPDDPPQGSWGVRRWRVTGIAADEPEAIAIDVCVYRLPGLNTQPAHADACLATIRVRQP